MHQGFSLHFIHHIWLRQWRNSFNLLLLLQTDMYTLFWIRPHSHFFKSKVIVEEPMCWWNDQLMIWPNTFLSLKVLERSRMVPVKHLTIILKANYIILKSNFPSKWTFGIHLSSSKQNSDKGCLMNDLKKSVRRFCKCPSRWSRRKKKDNYSRCQQMFITSLVWCYDFTFH